MVEEQALLLAVTTLIGILVSILTAIASFVWKDLRSVRNEGRETRRMVEGMIVILGLTSPEFGMAWDRYKPHNPWPTWAEIAERNGFRVPDEAIKPPRVIEGHGL